MMTPVSLFANITVIRHVVRQIFDSISSGTTQPLVDTGMILTSWKEKRLLTPLDQVTAFKKS
jgi:hypothetical protein